MPETIEFFKPRLVGKRFDQHAIPLEVLKDLAILEEMIIEVAKWCYLKDNPRRKRTRGLTDGISLQLTGIGEGSCVPKIGLVVDRAGDLFPPANQQYFEQAREKIIGAIDAAEHDKPVAEHLPSHLLFLFDRLGRSLRDDESVEFNPSVDEHRARLNKTTRRKLILASQVEKITDEVVLRGTIPECNQRSMTFELQVINGPRITAPFELHYLDTILEAHKNYRQGQGTRVRLEGIGRYDRWQRLKGVEFVERIEILDPNDVPARLDEFRALKDGWLDGKGRAPDRDWLTRLAESFDAYYPDELPLPYLYPTAEGGVRAEWSLKPHEISLEWDAELFQFAAEWHCLNVKTEQDETKTLNLAEADDWKWLAEKIRHMAPKEALA